MFYSDTKVSIDNGDQSVTGGNKLRLLPEEGVLKVHILHEKICIAFAGTVSLCVDIINKLCIEEPLGTDTILDFLQRELKVADDNSAFIVGLVIEGNIPSLFRVDKDEIEKGVSFWIGEKAAFEGFQGYFLKNEDKTSIVNKATHAFRDMLKSTKTETVGDFMITASYEPKYRSFIYRESVEAVGGSEPLTTNAYNPALLTEGTVGEGAFVVCNFVSNSIFKPAVCLFFSKGNLAYIYIPISKSNTKVTPLKIPNTGIDDLKIRVKELFDIELIGITVNSGRIEIM